MARKSPLKVYRTAIGFHDAYVAAPSPKPALEAWGTDKNLFARGAAEVVTDPALTAEPLTSPGKVVTRSRGGLAEQLKAAGPTRRAPPKRQAVEAPAKAKARPKPKPKPPPKPRPSRAALDEAEAALEAFQAEAEAELAGLRQREAELRKERERLESRQRAKSDQLARRVARAKERYEEAMDRWRRSI